MPRPVELSAQGRVSFDELVTTYPSADMNTAYDSESGFTVKPVVLLADAATAARG